MFKASTPTKVGLKNREDMTKSAGALNRVCEGSTNMKGSVCDHCECRNVDQKRFSLDINILKRLGGESKCFESDCDSRNDFNEKLELELIRDMDEMKLASKENRSSKYNYNAYSVDRVFGEAVRCRSVSHDTDESNLTAYPEFCDTSDNESCNGEESEFFWDAENKSRQEY